MHVYHIMIGRQMLHYFNQFKVIKILVIINKASNNLIPNLKLLK